MTYFTLPSTKRQPGAAGSVQEMKNFRTGGDKKIWFLRSYKMDGWGASLKTEEKNDDKA